MADNDVWIIGASMTKFGRYPDKDVIDLASDASMAALADGGVTIHDMEMLAAGNLMEASNMLGQRLQKQIGQTGIPVYNVANACATGATAVRTASTWPSRPARPTWAWPSACEQMGKMGLLGSAGQRVGDRNVLRAVRALRRGDARRGAILGTTLMPGVFAQAGMEYACQHDGVGFEQFAKVAEKNHAHSTLNPLAQYQKRVQPRRGHGRRHGGLPEHAAHVLPHRGRRRGGRARAPTPSSRPSIPTSSAAAP